MPVDETKWPLTAEFLRIHEKERAARQRQHPTLAWAYGAALDKNEQARMSGVMKVGHPLRGFAR